MKWIFLVVFPICFAFSSSAQLSEEFERLDSLASFKDVSLSSPLSNAKIKMGLIYIKGSEGGYTITNKKYLKIDDFMFSKGTAFFLFKKLKLIMLESSQSSSEYLNKLLEHFKALYGDPQSTEEGYYWIGNNISYSLVRNTVSGNVMIGITNMTE